MEERIIIGKSKLLRNIIKETIKVAQSKCSVLIDGETGTGKEMIAELIHIESPRKGLPLIKVNCGAIPQELLESELFGHEKGSFTGAHAMRKGRFELADGGTLFLDEISETSKAFQVKLLRVLQEKTFERVGGEKTITVDVRIIAASSKPLIEAVKNGDFREDLYYRLNVVNINLPPLRERKEDIPDLVNHFIEKYTKDVGIEKKVLKVSAENMYLLQEYSWPGNIRELENAVQNAIAMHRKTINIPESLNNTDKRLTTENIGDVKMTENKSDTVKIAEILSNNFSKALETIENQQQYINKLHEELIGKGRNLENGLEKIQNILMNGSAVSTSEKQKKPEEKIKIKKEKNMYPGAKKILDMVKGKTRKKAAMDNNIPLSTMISWVARAKKEQSAK